MIDREKVIKGLKVCRDQNNPPGYRFTSCVDDCPYHGDGCARKLKEDALALLKEQKAKKFLVDETGKITPLPVVVRCKDCVFGIREKNDSTGMTWIYCGHHRENRPEDWYCASGSRI